MADDIVQTVKLEGVDQTVSGFEKVEKAGVDAMAGIGRATPTANKAAGEFAAKIHQIEQASKRFGSSLRDLGSASQRFASNVGRMGATVAKYAAATGLGIAAVKKFSSAQQDQADDTKNAIAQSKLDEKGQADAAIRTLEHEKAVRDLNRQFGQGKISATEYAGAMADLQRTQKEEEEMARRVQLIRSAEKEDNERKAAAIRKADAAQKLHTETVRAYGADVASALTQLGPAYDSFMRKLNEGPSVIADIMRGITLLFNQHGTEIVKIVNDIGDAFASLFSDATTGGNRAQGFANTMIGAIRGVGSAIKDYLIPTIKTIVGWFDVLAKGFNAVFGTQLTGGVLAAGAALVVFSGLLPAIAAGITTIVFAFKALNLALSALTSLTPMGVAIRLIIVALVLLYTHWDKVKEIVGGVVDYVKKKWEEWSTWFTGFIEASKKAWDDWIKYIGDIFAGLVESAKNAAASILKFFIGLIPGLGPVLSFFEKLGKAISKAADDAARAKAEAGGHEQNPSEFKARGGPIHGRGTSTSDSVPVWASRGEWFIQAKAVQHYGRAFMSAVNSMRLPRGGFDPTALVLPSPKARFAMGGEVGGDRAGSRVLNLTLPGLGSFPGLTGPDDTMDRLQVAAVRSQIRSAGRLPGWYGGR